MSGLADAVDVDEDACCGASLEALRDTIARLPSELARALDSTLPAMAGLPGRVVTTGIGASEPPARLLASQLCSAGIPARFCATSAFARAEPPHGDLLVVFSQGLSPNALLAMAERHTFGRRWLVTSVGADSPSAEKRALRAELEKRAVEVVCLPPAHEPAWLVRIAGPTVAALGALRIAAELTGDASLRAQAQRAPDAYREGCADLESVSPPAWLRAGSLPDQPLALISLAAPPEGALAHRIKLMEMLLVPEPPVWDVLQFAHGPLQAYHSAPLTLLTLEGPSDGELVTRLAATLEPGRHVIRRLRAPTEGVQALFSHAAAIDALLLATLRERPRDLGDWPAKLKDGALYELGRAP